MPQLAFTTSQSIDDLSDRLGLRKLAKYHRHKLTPTTESFGLTCGPNSTHFSLKAMTIYQAKQLAKETRFSLPSSLPPLKVTFVVFHTNVLTRNGGLFHSSEKPILDTTAQISIQTK